MPSPNCPPAGRVEENFFTMARYEHLLSQTFQLVRDRQSLRTLIDNQSGPVEEAKKVRQQLTSIAKTTVRLASQGNPNAQLIVDQLKLLVDQLKQRAVTIGQHERGSK